ncbi:hypothetical protein GQ602_004478 [Ophiocordyceps camponoti-floridani]|uniref:Uncharacterized protein n=1 Tax=Ophiocordyceps camponoti-floridani TaxID=2030778 RepID=A0A8H4Q735_9HYPO|nr:hypothetical protein GQ602_004478 [Ophiocordyceps camponoti-floridani]
MESEKDRIRHLPVSSSACEPGKQAYEHEARHEPAVVDGRHIDLWKIKLQYPPATNCQTSACAGRKCCDPRRWETPSAACSLICERTGGGRGARRRVLQLSPDDTLPVQGV